MVENSERADASIKRIFGGGERKIDRAGRVAIPRHLIEGIGGELMISAWFNRSLALFHPHSWDEMIAKLAETVMNDKPWYDIETEIGKRTFSVKAEIQGRIVIPVPLRDYAHLQPGGLASVFGVYNRVEIWNVELLHRHEVDFAKRRTSRFQLPPFPFRGPALLA